MKLARTVRSIVRIAAVLPFLTLVQVSEGAGEDPTFINKRGDVEVLSDTRSLENVRGYTNEQLRSEQLPLEDSKSLVVSVRRIAAWMPSGEEFSAIVDEKKSNHSKALGQLEKWSKRYALDKVIKQLNQEEGLIHGKANLEEIAEDVFSRFDSLLTSSDGMHRLGVRVDRKSVFSNDHFIVANYYFRFDRESLLGEIAPTPIETTFTGPEFDPAEFSSDSHYVVRFIDRAFPVEKKVAKRETNWEHTFDSALKSLSSEAFKKVVYALNNDLRYPQMEPALIELIEQHTNLEPDSFLRYTNHYQIKKQEITRAQSQDTLNLSVLFFFERRKIQQLIVPPERTVELEVPSSTLAGPTVPTTSENTYVAVYQDQMIAVPDQVLDRDVARQKALVAAVDQFRKKALNEAAAYINQRLSQPVDNAKMGEVIAAAAANHSLYLKPIKWIGNPLVVTRGTYSTEPETLRMSAFLEVDQNALQQKLIADRAITLVGKYRTYVELFWNVPDKEVHPEVVATVVETIEDKLRQDGYEVVEFERIKGDLVALLESSEGKDADLYATDELQRFKANLALRNIDNRFENGKRILAEYADLLVGATINAIDVKSGELSIRTTVNATYFSQGEWHKLASASAVMSAPHIRGSTENLLDVAIQSTAKAVTDLKPRLKRQLGLRKDREKLLINQAREFSLYFGTADKDSFVEITRHLRQASKWQYKSADFKTRTVFITFAGAIDNLSDLIQLYLEGAGLKISVGEYSSGSNRIVFDG